MATTTGFLSQLTDAQRRWEERTSRRHTTLDRLKNVGVLGTDDPQRVSKRLARLGTDWSLATTVEQTPAVASTGRSLGEALAAESFGADVLGLERLLGRNDLIDVGFLEAGHLAARSVGRIVVTGSNAAYGTGFLVAPSLLLTNNHVLPTLEDAAHAIVEFNYQAGLDGQALVPLAFDLQPQRFFATDEGLDFTVVAVAERNADGCDLAAFGCLPLVEAEGKIILGETVNIIQHPNGEPKQLALRENEVVDVLEQFIHYKTDTAPGSSGSPVFNDQWEVVALHHSGIPLTDEHGLPVAIDGSRWTRDMGEQLLAWKANEGVRVSRILQALRQQPLTGMPPELRARLFENAARPGPAARPILSTSASATAPQQIPQASDGQARWTLPLQINVSVDVPSASVTRARADSVRELTSTIPGVNGAAAADADLRAALTDLEASQVRPYYDHDADGQARDRYYADITSSTGTQLWHALTTLVTETHERQPGYRPLRLVYPWVDLHPDRQLRSVYSGKTFTPEEFIRADAVAEAARIEHFAELLVREATAGPHALDEDFALLEAALPYNCEHVVPQSWFDKQEPMRGDLHHLFACETGCNSFRGNFPYVDFPDYEERLRQACGRREAEGFEPAAGKGPVARATLYFLLRYPRIVGDTSQELTPPRLDLLLSWHKRYPVSRYEQHRNAAIAEIQGNRNPFIDHPEWAEQIDFTDAWAAPSRL